MAYCNSCNRHFNSYDALTQHRANSSLHNYCVDCDRDFRTPEALTQHLENSSSHNYCSLCEEDFDTPDELDQHNTDEHYACGDCDEVFSEADELDEHIEDEHWYCSLCDRFFNNEHNLDQHLNFSRVHKERTYDCPGHKCGKKFSSWSALMMHFESGACPSGLNRKQLNKLVVKYDRNNMVTNPSKLITVKGELSPTTVTYNTWATERSYNGSAYECFLCHREFERLVGLNAHLQSPRHEEKIYRCPNARQCGIEYSALSALTQHVESNKCGVKRFKEVDAVMASLTRKIKTITL